MKQLHKNGKMYEIVVLDLVHKFTRKLWFTKEDPYIYIYIEREREREREKF